MLSFNCTVYVAPIHGFKIQIINRGYNLLHIVSKVYSGIKELNGTLHDELSSRYIRVISKIQLVGLLSMLRSDWLSYC